MSKQMLSPSQIRTPAKSQNCPTLPCHIIPLHTHLRSAKGRLSGASGYRRFSADTKEQHEPALAAIQETNLGSPAESLNQTLARQVILIIIMVVLIVWATVKFRDSPAAERDPAQVRARMAKIAAWYAANIPGYIPSEYSLRVMATVDLRNERQAKINQETAQVSEHNAQSEAEWETKFAALVAEGRAAEGREPCEK